MAKQHTILYSVLWGLGFLALLVVLVVINVAYYHWVRRG